MSKNIFIGFCLGACAVLAGVFVIDLAKPVEKPIPLPPEEQAIFNVCQSRYLPQLEFDQYFKCLHQGQFDLKKARDVGPRLTLEEIFGENLGPAPK